MCLVIWMNTKEKILNAALELFIENGFNETPTSLISKEAGVATGTLFHHFASKDLLINSLYLHCKDRMISTLMDSVHNQPTFRGKVEKMWENSMLWGINNPKDYQFFMQFSYSSYISKLTRDTGLMMFNDMTTIFVEGIELDIIKDMDVELLLSTISSMTMTQIHYFIQNPEKYKDKSFREKAFNLIWDSFKR